jgi:cytochrome P450
MDDLSWILADGESLEDALEDFTAEVENPELLKARHKQIRKIYKAGLKGQEYKKGHPMWHEAVEDLTDKLWEEAEDES